MTLSLIIVNYRSAKLVGELLESISRRGAGWVDRMSVESLRAGSMRADGAGGRLAGVGGGGIGL